MLAPLPLGKPPNSIIVDNLGKRQKAFHLIISVVYR